MPQKFTPEQIREKNEQWKKENTRQIKFRLNLRTDADILAHLNKLDNVQGYLKHLIRDDMTRQNAAT